MRGDLGIFWQLADGTGPVERLTKANRRRIARAGIVVAPAESGSCCSASERVTTSRCGCFRCRTRRSSPFARRPVDDQPDRRRLFPRRTMGRVYQHGRDRRPRSTCSRFRHGREVRAAGARRRRSARGHVVGRRQGALLQSAARRLRGRERHRRSRRSRSAIPVPSREPSRSDLPRRDGRTTSRRPASSWVHCGGRRSATAGQSAAREFNVVLNWFEELKQRVPR